jgi:hypothetical protein
MHGNLAQQIMSAAVQKAPSLPRKRESILIVTAFMYMARQDRFRVGRDDPTQRSLLQ